MENNEFNTSGKKYLEIEVATRAIVGRENRRFLTNRSIVELMRSLCLDINPNNCLIPNVNNGEFILCADKLDAYVESDEVFNVLEKTHPDSNINLIKASFIKTDIDVKYPAIVLFPPMGIRTEGGQSDVLYVKKSLSLLAKNGRIVILVPQNVLTAPAYKGIRELILKKFSLEAVFSLKRIGYETSVDCSILVIDNKKQNEQIYMSIDTCNAESIYDNYKQGKGGFYVAAEEVLDRFDANYYDPEYKEIRNLVQRRDTVKLGDIASIVSGIMIPSNQRKEHGDYIVVGPRNIVNGKIIFQEDRKIYCDRDFIVNDKRNVRGILKNGDVIISTLGEINWAVYHGENDYIVVNQHVAIIRGKQEYEEWLRLFFNTRTGNEALESQLKFLGHGSVFNHISSVGILGMYVPDIKLMKSAERMGKEVNLERKVASLFRELGWTVEEEYTKGTSRFDLALIDKGILKGVIDVKSYSPDQINRNQRMLVQQLNSIKDTVGDASVYLFVDDEIYEYFDGILRQLHELPRPGKENKIKNAATENLRKKETIVIEKGTIEETSISDMVLQELTRNYGRIMASLNRIERKVDSIAEKLESISKQIAGYQSLVDKQLELAVSPEEEERIIHAFSEECAERIIHEVGPNNSERDYNAELNKLILSFGESAWKKMDESSKTFLVSSKVIFNNLVGLQDIVDYSGVCLLVTKALEVELGKRFCKNFVAYLKQQYPGRLNYIQFPTPLLDKYGKPITPKHFTLGTVAYVCCFFSASDITEEQKENNRAKLIEYAKCKLLSGKTDDEIMDILMEYAEFVEKVKNDYRNPSAHTNKLRKVDAEQCFALVIDVEKLMKRMLDSFDE